LATRALPARALGRRRANQLPPTSSRIFAFISDAAFSVNVMARISPTCSTGGGPSGRGRRRWRKGSERTRVLPAPAPARPAAAPSTPIAASCSGVGAPSVIRLPLLVGGRLLVAADAPEGAIRVAGVRVDVEAPRPRARDEVDDALRDGGGLGR